MKKATAAMEFIFSYGWAVLAFITAVSALTYFGVLEFDTIFPSQCSMPIGVTSDPYP